MNVLMINGSTREKGCTYTALSLVAEELAKHGIDSQIYWVGNEPIRDCTACGACRRKKSACVFTDGPVGELIELADQADALVLGTATYFASPTGAMHSVLNRMIYSRARMLRGKPGAVVASARRAGTTVALESLSRYLAYCEMPIITSSYWNMVHGTRPEEVMQDLEGVQTMRNLGRNLAWLMNSLAAAKAAGIELPQNEYSARTNFIR